MQQTHKQLKAEIDSLKGTIELLRTQAAILKSEISDRQDELDEYSIVVQMMKSRNHRLKLLVCQVCPDMTMDELKRRMIEEQDEDTGITIESRGHAYSLDELSRKTLAMLMWAPEPTRAKVKKVNHA